MRDAMEENLPAASPTALSTSAGVDTAPAVANAAGLHSGPLPAPNPSAHGGPDSDSLVQEAAAHAPGPLSAPLTAQQVARLAAQQAADEAVYAAVPAALPAAALARLYASCPEPAGHKPADLSPGATVALLGELFPALFGLGWAKPIKLRIQADIQARAPHLFSKKALSVFLHRYTTNTAYLKSLLTMDQRFGLDGQVDGEVAPEHRAAAQEELDRRWQLVQERRAAERSGPRGPGADRPGRNDRRPPQGEQRDAAGHGEPPADPDRAEAPANADAPRHHPQPRQPQQPRPARQDARGPGPRPEFRQEARPSPRPGDRPAGARMGERPAEHRGGPAPQRTGNGPEQRQDQRPDQRPDHRPDHGAAQPAQAGQEPAQRRDAPPSGGRQDSRGEYRPGPAGNPRAPQRGEQRGDPRGEPRGDFRPAARQGPREGQRDGPRHNDWAEQRGGPGRPLHDQRPSAPAEPPLPDDPARRERALLLRTWEGSPLTPANFCALKGLKVAEFDARIAQAQQERKEAQQAFRQANNPRTP